MIKYELAEDIKEKVCEIIKKLSLEHIKIDNVICIRSKGSASYNIVARCHALSRIWQKALNTEAVYVIEVISEKFDKLEEEEKIKTLIHELLHIPYSFGGGFKHHSFVKKNISKLYEKFLS